MSDHNLSAPLQGGGTATPDQDDNASQTSHRSSTSTSLLERIRLQREREKQQQLSNGNHRAATSSSQADNPLAMQIQVPQYQPVEQGPPSLQTSAMESAPRSSVSLSQPAADASSGGGANFFQLAWRNIATSMETGMASLEQQRQFEDGYRRYSDDDRLDEALLLPTSGGAHLLSSAADEDYSMCNYFLTFVRDIYLGFVSVPLAGRVVIVVVLLYIAIKLL